MTEKPIIIQQEQHSDPKIIDLSDGINMSEALLILLVITSFFGKFLPFLDASKKIYNSIIYINKDELLLQVELQKLLDQILAITFADRVVIGLFHNGTQDLLGFHEKKMSVYAESCTANTKPLRLQLQGVPVNYIVEEILMSDNVHYQTITRSDLESACNLHMDSVGIVRKDFRTFRGAKKEIYGIINIHYIVEPEEHFLEDNARIKQVREITRRIEYILESIKAPDTPKWQRFIGGLIKNFTKD